MMKMRSYKEIMERYNNTDDETVERTLAWVMNPDESACPMCAHPLRLRYESQLLMETLTTMHVDIANHWPHGTAQDHMDNCREYNHSEAAWIEEKRHETISTLSVAESIAQKLVGWIEELEERKDIEGITTEWVGDAARLVGQANQSLRLIGQLKKEIGVDSQLLLAQNRVDSIMGILVDVLATEPKLLDDIELRMAALKEPTHVIDYTKDEDWGFEA